MNERFMTWIDGQSYLKNTCYTDRKEETCYEAKGLYADVKYYEKENYNILEWSNYMNEEKEEIMNLELNNLTDEQKKQIIELAKKFEQENALDKLDRRNDYGVLLECGIAEHTQTINMQEHFKEECFKLGLTAHTKEEAEKIRRRLLVEKELRDWAKKCKKPLRKDDPEVEKYMIAYEAISNEVYARAYFSHLFGEILFSEQKVAEQAIESIGQERLIRDYFGIEREEK